MIIEKLRKLVIYVGIAGFIVTCSISYFIRRFIPLLIFISVWLLLYSAFVWLRNGNLKHLTMNKLRDLRKNAIVYLSYIECMILVYIIGHQYDKPGLYIILILITLLNVFLYLAPNLLQNRLFVFILETGPYEIVQLDTCDDKHIIRNKETGILYKYDPYVGNFLK